MTRLPPTKPRPLTVQAPLTFALLWIVAAAGCGDGLIAGVIATRHDQLKGGFQMRVTRTTDNSFIRPTPWEGLCIKLTESYGRFFTGGAFAKLCVNVDLGWKWSDSGPIPGMRCVKFDEPEDDFPHVWDDNYLCYKDSDLARQLIFRWSHRGRLPNMTCHQVVCGHGSPDDIWEDNYFCHGADPTTRIQRDLGGPGGTLGKAAGQLKTATDGLGAFREFDKGAVYWHPGVGAYNVGVAILKQWKSLGAEQGIHGYPVAGEVSMHGGKVKYVHFQRGTIYHVDKLGTFVFDGPVHEKWLDLDWSTSEKAYPVSGIMTLTGARTMATFSNSAAVFHGPKSGYITVKGKLWQAWSDAGGLNGPGFPTSGQGTTKAGHAYQTFEEGAVYCFTNGCHALYGPIYKDWVKRKGIAGAYGYPMTSLIALDAPWKHKSSAVYFEGGPLFFATDYGVVKTKGTGTMTTVGEEVDLPLQGQAFLNKGHYSPASLSWCKGSAGYEYTKKSSAGANDFFQTIRDDLVMDFGQGNAVFNVRAGCNTEDRVKVTSRTIDGPGKYTPITRISGTVTNMAPSYVRGTINLVNTSGAARAVAVVLQIKDDKARWIDVVTKQLNLGPGARFVDLEGWVPHDCVVRFEVRVKNLNKPWDMQLEAVRLFGAQCYMAYGGSTITCYQG